MQRKAGILYRKNWTTWSSVITENGIKFISMNTGSCSWELISESSAISWEATC